MFDTSFRKKTIFIYFALLDECILEVYCSNIGEYCLKLSAIFQKNLKIPRDYQKPPIDKRMGKTKNYTENQSSSSMNPTKTGSEPRYSAKVSSSYPTSDTRRATAIRHQHYLL